MTNATMDEARITRLAVAPSEGGGYRVCGYSPDVEGTGWFSLTLPMATPRDCARWLFSMTGAHVAILTGGRVVDLSAVDQYDTVLASSIDAGQVITTTASTTRRTSIGVIGESSSSPVDVASREASRESFRQMRDDLAAKRGREV